jgi:hypothetical protein
MSPRRARTNAVQSWAGPSSIVRRRPARTIACVLAVVVVMSRRRSRRASNRYLQHRMASFVPRHLPVTFTT